MSIHTLVGKVGTIGAGLLLVAALICLQPPAVGQREYHDPRTHPLFVDRFQQEERSPLSPAWMTRMGRIQIRDRAAFGLDVLNMATLRGERMEDTEVTADINVPFVTEAGVTLMARYSRPDDYYMAGVGIPSVPGDVYTAGIYLHTRDRYTMLGVKPLRGLRGRARIRFQVVGDSLRLHVNGELAVNATDRTLTEGRVGMRLSRGATLDNFALTRVRRGGR